MTRLAQSLLRAPRIRATSVVWAAQPRRYAHGSYGNEQSGQEQGTNMTNPKRHLEHPGPDTPATQKANADQDGKSASSDQSGESTSSSDSRRAGGARPAIHTPKSAAEDSSPEVRKHNEEMKQRADRSVNQLGEDDNKVDKKFWQGDVGDIKKDK